MATAGSRQLNSQIEEKLKQVSQHPLPRHIAIIMDGNGRWAKRHGKERTLGHRQGVETAREIVEFVIAPLGIETLTLYAFSTENWYRPRHEVDFLMDLIQRFLREQVDRLVRKNVKLRILGDVSELPPSVQFEIARALDRSAKNDGLRLNLAVNYGGRQEILSAVKTLAQAVKEGVLAPENIDEATFERALFTRELPDPDLLIRTAEQRLSNFLLWQAAYAEFWTTPVPWPEFGVAELLDAVLDFQRRQRTFGGPRDHA